VDGKGSDSLGFMARICLPTWSVPGLDEGTLYVLRWVGDTSLASMMAWHGMAWRHSIDAIEAVSQSVRLVIG